MLNNWHTWRPFIIYSLERGVEDFEGGSRGFQGEQRDSIRRQSIKGVGGGGGNYVKLTAN